MKRALAALLLAATAGHAHADDPYKLQIGASEFTGAVLIVSAFGVQSEHLLYAGAGVLELGPAIIHVAHGRPVRGAASAAVRLGGTIAGGTLVRLVAGACRDRPSYMCQGSMTRIVAGGVVGFVAGAVVDWTVLADIEADDDGMPAARMLSFGGSF